MRKQIIVLGLMTAATTIFALDCGNLGIRIENVSKHNCVLKHSILSHGRFQTAPPINIPAGVNESNFYTSQDYDGISVELDYRCDDNLVIIQSSQSYCGFYAGYVQGWTYSANDLSTEHHEVTGSYWSETPGYISWKFY